MDYFIEKVWWYRNFQCSVVFGRLGYRCGYVLIPKGMKMPQQGRRHVYIDLDVHGDVTYNATTLSSMGTRYRACGMKTRGGIDIIGFDCGHIWDGFDFSLAIKRFKIDIHDPLLREIKQSFSGNIVRSQEYCEKECRGMVDQIIEYNKSGDGV